MAFAHEQVEGAVAQLLARWERRFAAREATRARVRSLLPEAKSALCRLGARRVVLFDSLDAAWLGEESDVDLAVEGLPDDRLGEAELRLRGLLGVRLDLMRLEEADASLRRAIEREGREL